MVSVKDINMGTLDRLPVRRCVFSASSLSNWQCLSISTQQVEKLVTCWRLLKRIRNRAHCLQLVLSLTLQTSGLLHVLRLTFLLLVGRFHIHRVEWEARFSRNGEVGNTQGVHLLFSLTPGAAL